MFELIRANKVNSILLMALMAVVLAILGTAIGQLLFGPKGGWYGLLIAAAVWGVLALISLTSGDKMLLAASQAKRITHDVHPQLFNVVEEMSIAAALPMPKIYIINEPAPNAFATGRNPQNASVAVTAGLLTKLNRDELQGVIAHEMSHILHRDILYVTLAGIMLGAIVLLSQGLLRGMFYSSLGGSNRRYSSNRGNSGQGQIIMVVIAVVVAILAPIMAQLLYFALSRQREYLADAEAARLTRYPEGLASALEKIANDTSGPLKTANKATAPMYIANPMKLKGNKLSDLTSTHPPISKRIQILRSMSQGASFNDYSTAFAKVTGSASPLPSAATHFKEPLPLRGPSVKEKTPSQTQQMHQLGDIIRTVNGFTFLACTCGLKLKVPPNFNQTSVKCPRCKSILDLPKPGTAKA